MTSLLFISIGGFGAAACATAAWLTSRDSDGSQLADRLRRLSDGTTVEEVKSLWMNSAALPAGDAAKRTSIMDHLLPAGSAERQRFALRMQHAGLVGPHALPWFFLARLVGMMGPFVVCFLLCYGHVVAPAQAVWLAAAPAGIGWILPSVWLDRRIAERQRTLRRSLPDFLDLLIICLQSGMSVPSALQRVGQEINVAHPLLASELEIVQRDTALGAPVDAALLNFANRSGVEVVREMASFLRETRRFGAEVVDALRLQADTIRFQREQAAEESAQKATVKLLFPMLLFILPGIFVVLVGPAVLQIQQAFTR